MEDTEMPIGLGMALAMNTQAMQRFFELSEAQKREIISGAHNVRSKKK